MHKLFVRLVACGLLAGSLGATALADGSGIELTGPGSTNVVTSSHFNSVFNRINNRVTVGNFNNQFAQTGGVFVHGNTIVHGSGLGSGSAFNFNSGSNDVFINNHSNGSMPWWGGSGSGGGGGTIFLTGPHSFNAISSNNSNRFSSTTTNNVRANNFSSQTARSGAVVVTGNTLVTGVGGSGNAANFNSGSNTVGISNSSPSWSGSWGSGSGGGGGFIGVTGPGSFNAIRNNSSNRFTQTTSNNVSAINSNRQTATTGPVVVSGNTVVSGVGGSGDATNWNSGMNDVNINNR